MKESILDSLERWLYPKGIDAAVLGACVLTLLFASWATVYFSGGTTYAYVHVFYIPILFSGFFFSVPGGVVIAVLSGLVAGPLMPLDVAEGLAQPFSSWAIRLAFFVLVGASTGIGSSLFRRYIKQVKERFTTNQLTGLPNLNGLQATFKELIRDHPRMGVVLMDIGNIGEIELAVGQTGLQSLMKQIASELIYLLPDTVTLGHPRHSSFVILVHDQTETDSIVKACHNNLNASYQINQIPVFVERFFGVTSYPNDDDELPVLLRKARLAIAHAASQAQQVAKYQEIKKSHETDNVILLNDLNTAIQENTLKVHYQPKVDLITGQIMGVEALVRWTHPSRGAISPDQLIPLTERTLLINPFTKWLLTRTLADMDAWQTKGLELNLALNFSIRNFHDKSTISKLFSLCEKHQINTKKLEIELTESAFSSDINQVNQVVSELRDQGLKVSIDDFGTGLASQQYLYELPIDGLKIDQVFVQGLGKNPAAQAIVESAIALGHRLDLTVTAEGIETKEQLKKVTEMGCDFGQGFYIAKPMPYKDLINWIRDFKSNSLS